MLVKGVSSTTTRLGLDCWLHYQVHDLEDITHPSDLQVPHLSTRTLTVTMSEDFCKNAMR